MEAIKRGLLVFIFISLLLVFPLTIANQGEGGDNAAEEKITLSQLLDSKNEVNTYLQENEVIIPKGVGSLIKDGNILVNISMNDGSLELFYITIEDKRVVSVGEGVPEDISYEIRIEEQTINEIVESGRFGERVVAEYKNGNIYLKAYGFGNKFKLFFGKIFFGIFT